ncbi:MAG: adenylosuccinate synthase [Deltaproteobacteria bacterium]|nr:adenylosuccinate synthase [Deltaproteobacteria bacterium]
MTALVAVGAQWGDEGKGKIVDWLALTAGMVVRFQGGNNAGHTLIVEGRKTVLHLVPSGILQPGVVNLIGPGVVVDPGVLLQEVEEIAAQGILRDPARLRVSGRAHVVTPWHGALDRAREQASSAAIGTTGRGIGPAYEDKVARRGIRVADLQDGDALGAAVERLAAAKNFELCEVHGQPAIEAGPVIAELTQMGRRLAPYIGHTGHILDRALGEGRKVLFEGAQGTFLDIDHGTYPYVTSSNCIAGAACAGAGIGPTRVDRVIGITKAYATRVGGGPFPTEDTGAGGQHLGERGAEFGATTGRRRRCGWLDGVVLREAAIINGFSSLAVNKLDILSGLPEIPVAVAWSIDGKRTAEFPMTLGEVARAEPIYESLPGWEEDLSGMREFAQLPANARRYIARIEELAGVPVDLISVGPGRDQTLARRDPFAA